jgi:hypothetical protein
LSKAGLRRLGNQKRVRFTGHFTAEDTKYVLRGCITPGVTRQLLRELPVGPVEPAPYGDEEDGKLEPVEVDGELPVASRT